MQHLTTKARKIQYLLVYEDEMDKKYYNVPLAIKQDAVDFMGADSECQDRGIESLETNCEFISVDGTLDKCDYDCIREELYRYEAEGKPVCFVFDSCGGSTVGLLSLANQIKDYPYPTLAYVDGSCCSAAYMLASACDKIIATKDSELGSIGVLAVLADITEMDKQMGVEFTVLRSRDAKALYNPHEKVNKDVVESVMAKLMAFDAIFYDFVETNRPVNMDAITGLAGGTVLANEAKSLGLCDDIIDYLGKYLQTNSAFSASNEVIMSEVTNVATIDYAAKERERVIGIMEAGSKLKVSAKAIESAIKRGDSLESTTAMFMAIREELDSTYSPTATQHATQMAHVQETTTTPKEFAGGKLSINDLLASLGG